MPERADVTKLLMIIIFSQFDASGRKVSVNTPSLRPIYVCETWHHQNSVYCISKPFFWLIW